MSAESSLRAPAVSVEAPASPPIPVVSVNGQVVAAALRRDPNPAPQLGLRMAHAEPLQGPVLLQILTTEGPLLLAGRAQARRDGTLRVELAPLEPVVRAWLQEQGQ